MKEKMMKLGVLATAFVLAFVFAACAQPTEEVGVGTPAIIRLYLDRPETKTLAATDTLYLRAGESFATSLANGAADITMSTDVVDASALADTTIGTNLNHSTPEVAYFGSGLLTLINADKTDITTTGTPIAVTTNAQYYVDFELVNHTINLVEKGSNLDGSYSLYLELTTTAGGSTGGLPAGVYYYTPEKTSLNDWDGTNWTTDQRNIQTVDIGPGVNELYLSQFTSNAKAP